MKMDTKSLLKTWKEMPRGWILQEDNDNNTNHTKVVKDFFQLKKI